MPVKAKKIGKKYRVIEVRTGRIVKRDGKAIDSGGSTSKAKVVKQVQAVNLSQRRAEGKPAPPKPRRKR